MKSFIEFLNENNNIFYHGSDVKNTQGILKSGLKFIGEQGLRRGGFHKYNTPRIYFSYDSDYVVKLLSTFIMENEKDIDYTMFEIYNSWEYDTYDTKIRDLKTLNRVFTNKSMVMFELDTTQIINDGYVIRGDSVDGYYINPKSDEQYLDVKYIKKHYQVDYQTWIDKNLPI